MKQCLLFLLITMSCIIAQAQDQPKGNNKITGIVMDSTDNVAVQFATIALVDPKTNKPLDGTVADDNGKFTLVKVPAGEFNVVISFVGYQTKTFRVKPTDKRDEINLGAIKLGFEAAFLNDVVVEG